MVYDLIISGAGPAGCRLAALVADKGYKVLLLEEHPVIGEPVQCAGLVTERALELTGSGRDCVLKEITGARVLGPGKEELALSSPRKKVIAIDRGLFDRDLGEKAVDKGAEVRKGTRVKDVKEKEKGWNIRLQDGSGVDGRYLAGCDGPSSLVRRRMGLPKPRTMLSGIEVEAASTWEDDRVVVKSSPSIAPGFFAWAIPIGEGRSRVGLAVDPRKAQHSAKAYLQMIIADPSLLGIPPFEIKGWLGGAIPLSPPADVSRDRGLLVGDAAAQVKATSGGGVVMGLRCAGHAAEALADAMERDGAILSYDQAWKEDVGKELRRDWALHQYHAGMSEKAQSRAFRNLSHPHTLETINNIGDIDYPSRLVLPLIKGNPRLFFMLPGIALRFLFS